MRTRKLLVLLVVFCLGGCATAARSQTATATAPAEKPLDAKSVLKLLEDRKSTLKNFTADVDYNVETGRTNESSGKRGKADFLIDAKDGPIFSIKCGYTTRDGKLLGKCDVHLIFDGRFFLVKDYDGKQFLKTKVLPDGAKPGDAANLNAPVVIPIGLPADDVMKAFEVTVAPAKEVGQVVLTLVPREKQKVDYEKLEVTVDKRPEVALPVKIARTEKNGDITTITLTNVKINSGEAKMADATVPPGWRDLAGQ